MRRSSCVCSTPIVGPGTEDDVTKSVELRSVTTGAEIRPSDAKRVGDGPVCDVDTSQIWPSDSVSSRQYGCVRSALVDSAGALLDNPGDVELTVTLL